MPLDPRIFRAYDIRGRYPTQIDEDSCWSIGEAFGFEVAKRSGKKNPQIVVGRDARLSSPSLLQALTEGLLSAGCNVLDIGETPSPLNYFTICTLDLDGGAQVTASHNPGTDNGIKLQLNNAEAFSGEDLQRLREKIEERARAGEVPSPSGRGLGRGEKGTTQNIDVVIPYLARMQSMFGAIGNGMTIVIDCGNGVAGPVYVQALKNTGARVIELFTTPDGNFPNHPADPSKHTTLIDLQKTVLAHHADIGIAFDGDGDRVGIVDEKGVIRTADELLLLLAKDLLIRHPGSPVVFTVSNSSILDTEIRRLGGRPIMCKVGHSFVEHVMQEHGALLGGEQSGHFFCAEDYYGFDDALVTALRILKLYSSSLQLVTRNQNHQIFSQLFSEFPKVYQSPERRPHCPDDRKATIIAAITEYFAARYPVNTLDGARIDFGEGAWAGIRQSNTSPCISLCMEARSPEDLRRIEEILLTHLRSYAEFKDIE